jgi:hypothetical protein
MPTKHKTDSKDLYKPDDKEQQPEKTHLTFITPFVAFTLLTLPSLVVLAYGKQTVAFKSLIVSGVYTLALAALWILVPLAVISGLIYILRGKNRSAKAIVAIVSVVLVAGFSYVVWPQ